MSKKKKKNRTLRYIISSILSFLLAILLTVGTFLVGIYAGFLNENRIIDGLNYKDYYTSAEEFFYQNAADTTIPIGLPESVVTDIVDSKTVYEDIRGYVLAAVKGKEYEFHTDELKRNLTKNVNQYISTQGLEMNEEQQATIPQYVQLIADQYEEDLQVPFIGHFAKLKATYQKVIAIAFPVIAVFSAVIIMMMIRMYRWKHRAMRFLIYSTSSAAIMVSIPAVVALVTGFYKRINISSEYVYYAFTKYIGNGFLIFLYMAAGWMIISAGLLLLIKYLKSNS